MISSSEEWDASQPSIRFNFSLLATNTAGSPGRRGPSFRGIFRPVTPSAASITSKIEKPRLLPTLNASPDTRSISSNAHAWDQVCFHAMMLTALLGSASGVEIAKARILQTGIRLVIRQNALEDQFRFSIRIDRRFTMIFGNGHDFRLAVGRRCR